MSSISLNYCQQGKAEPSYGIAVAVETSGLSTKDSLLGVSLRIFSLDTVKELSSYNARVQVPQSRIEEHLFEGNVPINGITTDDLNQGKSLQTISKEISQLLRRFRLNPRNAVVTAFAPGFHFRFIQQLPSNPLQVFSRVDLACWESHGRIHVGCPHHRQEHFGQEVLSDTYALPQLSYPRSAETVTGRALELLRVINTPTGPL